MEQKPSILDIILGAGLVLKDVFTALGERSLDEKKRKAKDAVDHSIETGGDTSGLEPDDQQLQ